MTGPLVCGYLLCLCILKKEPSQVSQPVEPTIKVGRARLEPPKVFLFPADGHQEALLHS